MKRSSVVFASLALSLVTALPACAGVVYNQAVAPDRPNSAWLSQTSNGTGGAAQAWDNFTLGGDATVTTVSWAGWINPYAGQIDSFTISFYDSVFDATYGVQSPGAMLLYTTTITGNAGQVALPGGLSTPRPGTGGFSFSADIAGYTFLAGQEYWISIVADPNTTNAASWSWANSNGGDSSFYGNNDGTGHTNAPIGTDLAFTLSTPSAVPEPSSLMLAGTGVFGLAGVVRRRFRGR